MKGCGKTWAAAAGLRANKFKSNGGFTLIEFIIVIILLVILAAFVDVRPSGSIINLSAQADLMGNDIRYAQMLSMTSGARYRFVQLSSTSYQITNSSGVAITMPSGGTSVTLQSGISFGTWGNLPNNLIVFNTRGVPYVNILLPGTALAATATIPLTAGGNTKTISISQITGWATW